MKKWFVRGIIVVQFVVIALLALRLGEEADLRELRHWHVQVEEYPYGTFQDTWDEWKFLSNNPRTAFIQEDGAPLWYDRGALMRYIPDMETLYKMIDKGL